MTKHLFAIFTDEGKLLAATKALRDQAIPIADVFTPYAVHGLDDAMGLRRSRLPVVTFLAGLVGLAIAMLLQCWTSAVDWPINVGGKPFMSIPAFIPVAFELTVLIGGLSTVLALFIRTGLYPGAKKPLAHPKVTDNHFAIALEKNAIRNASEVDALLRSFGASEIKEG